MQGRAILGIIGNVGPEADELLQRLIRLEATAHGAKKDQDYLPMIVVKNPEITDKKENTSGSFFIAPKPEVQENFVQSAIYGSLDPSGRHDRRNADGLKSGREDMAVERLSGAIRTLVEQEGLNVFIAGCTEVSIVVEKLRSAFPQCTFVDPMKCLAQHAYSLTIAVEQLLTANENIEPIDLETALKDQGLVAGYVAGKIRAHRRRA